MTIMHVSRNKGALPIKNQPLILRNGQIVQGEIMKIYPENKADIRIGTHRFIAETNIPLVIGKKYFFQVHESENQVIQLKVIADASKQNSEQNITNLLDKLGLKANRIVMQFINALLADKIPFTKQQIIQAMNILQVSSISNREAIDVLKEMFVSRLPINKNIFHALHTVRTNEFTTLIQELRTELQNSPPTNMTKQLQNLLEQLFSRPPKSEVTSSILPTSTITKNELALLFQMNARNIFPEQSASNIQHRVAQLITFLLPNMMTFAQGSSTNINVPIQQGLNVDQQTITYQQLTEMVSRFIENRTLIQARANELVKQFPSINAGKMTNESFHQLLTQINRRLIPLLPQKLQQPLLSLLQQSRSENEPIVHQLLQSLSDEKTFQLLEKFSSFQQGGNEQSQLHVLTKMRFITYVQQFIQQSGMLDEHHLKTNIEQILHNRMDQSLQQAQTVKTLLINLLQEGSNVTNEKIQPLIHFLNGLQLQSVYESNNLLQASLQLPGEKFALPKDLFFQFEGKKKEDGKLDPNHCRILFLLHLQHLQETVIDMFVQKRIVTLTIYNDHIKESDAEKEKFLPILTKQLNKLNFQLSAIKWKPLKDHTEQRPLNTETKTIVEQRKEGFDFRI